MRLHTQRAEVGRRRPARVRAPLPPPRPAPAPDRDLIQDFDPEKPNYGVVADHPERVDLNYVLGKEPCESDKVTWTHANALDYNAELDQIMITVRQFSEIWIIDHSATTEEAAGSVGGNAGKGGDLLYRWGNPPRIRRRNARGPAPLPSPRRPLDSGRLAGRRQRPHLQQRIGNIRNSSAATRPWTK